MSASRARIAAVVVGLLAAAVLAYRLLPRHYWIAEQVSGVTAFWHEDEAFVFVGSNGLGRTTNWVSERVSDHEPGPLVFLFYDWRSLGHTTLAYRLAGSHLLREELPEAPAFPAWDLHDGRLVARPRFEEGARGFEWNGSGFSRSVPIAGAPAPAPPGTLVSDADEEEEGIGPVGPAARLALKQAGWHFKSLTGYEGLRSAVDLPIELQSGRYALRLAPPARQEPLLPGGSVVTLSGPALPVASVLFAPAGWQEVDRAAFERRLAGSPRLPSAPRYGSWTVLALLLGYGLMLLLRLGGAAEIALPFLGLKKRILKNIATAYAFPPALPEQFPQLDRQRLDAYSRELEDLGFERLLDFSLLSDRSGSPPNFCRLYAHSRHACNAEVMQFFPAGKRPLALACSVSSALEDGWRVAFTSHQPQATAALIRRPRAVGVSLPGAPPAELLHGLLQLRDQMCVDLGVRPLTECGLQAYISRSQEGLQEMREAVKRKNMAVGLGQIYYRKLALLRARPQHVWLGDYPRIAEERKQSGLGGGFSGGPAGR